MRDMSNPQPSNFTSWFTEAWNRLGLKSSRFFTILQWAGLIATLIGFIPDALSFLNVTLPPALSVYLALALKVAGAVTILVARLQTVNTGAIVEVSAKLPFTEKKKEEGTDPTAAETKESLIKKP